MANSKQELLKFKEKEVDINPKVAISIYVGLYAFGNEHCSYSHMY